MDKLTIKAPEADAEGKDANAAMTLPPGSYTVAELAEAAKASPDKRGDAVDKANQTGTDRLAPGLSPDTKRIEVTDERTGVTEQRIVPKSAKERGAGEGEAPASDPATKPETTTSSTTSSTSGSKASTKGDSSPSTSTTSSGDGKAGSEETE